MSGYMKNEQGRKNVGNDNKRSSNGNNHTGYGKKSVKDLDKSKDKSPNKSTDISTDKSKDKSMNKSKQSRVAGMNYRQESVLLGKKPSDNKSVRKSYADYEDLDDYEDFTNVKDRMEYLKSEKKKGQKVVASENRKKPAGQKKDMGSVKRTEVREAAGIKTRDNLSKSGRSNDMSPGKGKPSVNKGACQYLRECGGCKYLKQPYEVELKEKQKHVEGLLKTYCKVEPIIGMKDPKHYRNKVHVVFDHDRKGNPVSGVYEEGTHRVVPINSCRIHNEKADAIIASIRGMLKSFKIKTYDEDSGYGLLRHVLIRTGFASGQIMVVLVLASPIFPSKNNFVKALLKLHPEITTIVVNVNDKQTSMVLGEKEQVIYGKGFIEDSLCGKIFRISPKSFYQVNPAQTEVIYGKAIELAKLSGTEVIVDAYCGIGTIGIIASDHVKKVIGVELNKDAVKDAVLNAKRNEVSNTEFYNNDAGEFMTQMAEQKESVDVVFMDPPRTGSNEKFMDAVAALSPKKVVYISCNPVTLERDLKYFMQKGYRASVALPVDMFPWTAHVETVVLMSRVGK